VVMVSLDGCPFCRTARQSHLVPMWREGQTMVQVDLRSSVMTRDFEGRSVSHDELTRRWKVGIAPTLMFFGPGGQEVADRWRVPICPIFTVHTLKSVFNKAASAWVKQHPPRNSRGNSSV